MLPADFAWRFTIRGSNKVVPVRAWRTPAPPPVHPRRNAENLSICSGCADRPARSRVFPASGTIRSHPQSKPTKFGVETWRSPCSKGTNPGTREALVPPGPDRRESARSCRNHPARMRGAVRVGGEEGMGLLESGKRMPDRHVPPRVRGRRGVARGQPCGLPRRLPAVRGRRGQHPRDCRRGAVLPRVSERNPPENGRGHPRRFQCPGARPARDTRRARG